MKFLLIFSVVMIAQCFQVAGHSYNTAEVVQNLIVGKGDKIKFIMLVNVGINPATPEIHSNLKTFHKTTNLLCQRN